MIVSITSNTESPKTEGRKKNARIAVVDDNQEICSMISKMLAHFGWREPSVMHDGEEIVEAIQSREQDFDLVIMDYHLPRMNGIEAGRAISKSRPHVRIILTTSDGSVESQAVSRGFRFLRKPFSFKSLAQILFL